MQKNQLTKIQKDKVFFLTGGGTGGHIYPCVSIFNALKKKGFENIFYVGNRKNPEFEISKGINVPFLDVPVFGMPRKPDFKLLRWIILLFVSIFKCLYYALKYKPDTVFASGGYVSAPMVIVSNILKIPYVMHDSDARPGIVTRKFSKNASAVNLAFMEGKKFIKAKKITHFKNPVREEFFTMSKEEAKKELQIKNEFCVLIMGGSQGAKSINSAAIGALEHFADKNIKIIFQTGKKNFDDVTEALKDRNISNNHIIRPYFEKMYIPVLASDLIISRAGSLSISEILAAKKPSILVPYPYAAADHQRKNAREIEKTGAAIYVEDSDLTSDLLINIIEDLISNKEKLNKMAQIAAQEIKENPTDKILDLILTAAKALKQE